VDRAPGLSVRLKLTLSYAGFLMLAGALMLAAAWLAGQHRQSFEFLLRYVPDGAISTAGGLVPGNSSFLLRAYAPAAAIVLAFLLVFGLLGGWLLAGRMLAPLTRITDATRMAGTGSLSHRIRLPGRRDEFRELADAFDTMLTRLEAHVAEQQRFAANASHELRTPLAITQTLLDVARNDLNRDTGELVDRLHAVNTRAIDLTEALLLLSRADQRSFTREHMDLSLIAEEATETLLPLAEERGLTIETSGDVTPTIGSYALLLQMGTNLVHNAIVHNLPEQGTVWVTTSVHPKSVHPKSVVLTVENTGEKLAPQLVSTLVEPFQRGSERIRTDHGVGLGLAIVKSIAQAHDGTLTLTPRAAGGLRVTVQLPAAPPHTGPDLKSSRRGTNRRRRVETDGSSMEPSGRNR
jgi:two-component system sensor histidine kinase VanS